MMILSFIFISLAAICNALMDKVETTISFKDSIFRHKKVAFWCKPISAHNVNFIPHTTYRADAWHLAKSAMIVLFVSSAVFYNPCIENFIEPFVDNHVIVGKLIFIFTAGVIYNSTFNLFYNKIFKKKDSV